MDLVAGSALMIVAGSALMIVNCPGVNNLVYLRMRSALIRQVQPLEFRVNYTACYPNSFREDEVSLQTSPDFDLVPSPATPVSFWGMNRHWSVSSSELNGEVQKSDPTQLLMRTRAKGMQGKAARNSRFLHLQRQKTLL